MYLNLLSVSEYYLYVLLFYTFMHSYVLSTVPIKCHND